MRASALLALALPLLLGACGDANVGRGGRVVEAHVVEVLETGTREIPGLGAQPFQVVRVQLDTSLYRGEQADLNWGGRQALNENGLLSEGDQVLLAVTRDDAGGREYAIQEVVRLPGLAPFVVLLVLVLLAVARFKGLAALTGLAASIAVFLLAIVPAVQRGEDPLFATLVGAAAVLGAAVFVVHGFNRKSIAALLGTLAGLATVVVLALIGLSTVKITGLGNEEAIFVAVGSGGGIDMARLALAGIIAGSLGALVDMAIGQSSTVFELAAVDPALRGRPLYGSALNVGHDHIGSLINTLALAYFGGALPLIVLLSLGFTPLSVAVNSEEIVSAVLTVLVASIGLVLCVPITTAFAVWLVPSRIYE